MAAAVLNYVALLNDGQQHEKALLLLERLFSSTNHSLSDAPGSLSSLACASPVASVSGPALASTAPHGADQSWGEWWPAALEAAENHMLLDMHMALAHTLHRGNVSDEAESLYREILVFCRNLSSAATCLLPQLVFYRNLSSAATCLLPQLVFYSLRLC